MRLTYGALEIVHAIDRSQSGGHSQESGGELEGGIVVRAATTGGALSDLISRRSPIATYSCENICTWGSKLYLKTQPIGPRPQGKRSCRNAPGFDLRTELYRITGIDWAQIDGIDVLAAQTAIAEAGADLSAFRSERQFVSWLGLRPTKEKGGGKS